MSIDYNTITKDQLVVFLLHNCGWEWIQSDQPGYVRLSDGDGFTWLLNNDFTAYHLLEMILSRSEHYKRQLEGKNETNISGG